VEKVCYPVQVDVAGSELVADTAPTVSVVIPCYNEERYIGKVLEMLLNQYEHEHYEIIVVDGRSTDSTREVVEAFIERTPSVRVRLVDNPARNIPTALNIGVREATGDVIVRMDAHSIPSPNYVRRCLNLMKGPNVSIVGTAWIIHASAETRTARAIALAASHPFGVGDADYRRTNLTEIQDVDTVPFGVFHKRLWEQLGGFNESLLANEDYDFNYRARRMGGRVILDPTGPCNYFARASLKDLARQYFRYGRWKAQMVKLHPLSIRWRQVAAPAFVLSIIFLSLSGLWWPQALWLLLSILVAYTLLSSIFSFSLSRGRGDLSLLPAISAAFFTMHIAWGGGFLLGLFRPPRHQG
jgi:succinoglycan biosynthesis protein ExoA